MPAWSVNAMSKLPKPSKRGKENMRCILSPLLIWGMCRVSVATHQLLIPGGEPCPTPHNKSQPYGSIPPPSGWREHCFQSFPRAPSGSQTHQNLTIPFWMTRTGRSCRRSIPCAHRDGAVIFQDIVNSRHFTRPRLLAAHNVVMTADHYRLDLFRRFRLLHLLNDRRRGRRRRRYRQNRRRFFHLLALIEDGPPRHDPSRRQALCRLYSAEPE